MSSTSTIESLYVSSTCSTLPGCVPTTPEATIPQESQSSPTAIHTTQRVEHLNSCTPSNPPTENVSYEASIDSQEDVERCKTACAMIEIDNGLPQTLAPEIRPLLSGPELMATNLYAAPLKPIDDIGIDMSSAFSTQILLLDSASLPERNISAARTVQRHYSPGRREDITPHGITQFARVSTRASDVFCGRISLSGYVTGANVDIKFSSTSERHTLAQLTSRLPSSHIKSEALRNEVSRLQALLETNNVKSLLEGLDEDERMVSRAMEDRLQCKQRELCNALEEKQQCEEQLDSSMALYLAFQEGLQAMQGSMAHAMSLKGNMHPKTFPDYDDQEGGAYEDAAREIKTKINRVLDQEGCGMVGVVQPEVHKACDFIFGNDDAILYSLPDSHQLDSVISTHQLHRDGQVEVDETHSQADFHPSSISMDVRKSDLIGHNLSTHSFREARSPYMQVRDTTTSRSKLRPGPRMLDSQPLFRKFSKRNSNKKHWESFSKVPYTNPKARQIELKYGRSPSPMPASARVTTPPHMRMPMPSSQIPGARPALISRTRTTRAHPYAGSQVASHHSSPLFLL